MPGCWVQIRGHCAFWLEHHASVHVSDVHVWRDAGVRGLGRDWNGDAPRSLEDTLLGSMV
jgi:hypothetical protein